MKKLLFILLISSVCSAQVIPPGYNWKPSDSLPVIQPDSTKIKTLNGVSSDVTLKDITNSDIITTGSMSWSVIGDVEDYNNFIL